MYFYKEQGKQLLDMHGDLLITQSNSIIAARSKSAAPSKCINGAAILLPRIDTPWKKLKAILIVARKIWKEGGQK